MDEGALRRRNNITEHGPTDGPVLLFAHGFGTDQGMYHRILPRFTDRYRVVLFDHVGSGQSDHAAYDAERYSSIEAYRDDLLEICDGLDLRDVTVVGHSVGAMMAISAAALDSSRLAALILMAASPSYMDRADGYDGGFSREDLDELFASLDANYLVWAARMAPVFMGAPQLPALGTELEAKFQRTNPQTASEFARVSFLTDVRHLLGEVPVPALILQCQDDVVAPVHIGAYLHDRLRRSTLVNMTARGHFPQVSAPGETADAMLDFLVEVLATSVVP